MEFSIDMLAVGNADAIIIWYKELQSDTLLFLDTGNPGDGEKIIKHYEKYIAPYIAKDTKIIILISHPHNDHLGGLTFLLNYFKSRINTIYINDPNDYLNVIQNSLINEYFNKYGSSNKTIRMIYESLRSSNEVIKLIDAYKINRSVYFSDLNLGHKYFRIKSPSMFFYTQQIQYFGDQKNLEKMAAVKYNDEEINEAVEGVKPCEIVDEINDDSSENICSSILEITDGNNWNYLFTADASVDSFISAQNSGKTFANFRIVQLPHHGSRRNINSNLIKALDPKTFWVSANGDKKHPRKAVLECIKKNLPLCKVYSTHHGGSKHINSVDSLFPKRTDYKTAESLI